MRKCKKNKKYSITQKNVQNNLNLQEIKTKNRPIMGRFFNWGDYSLFII